jgi:hypothetical protein
MLPLLLLWRNKMPEHRIALLLLTMLLLLAAE